MTASRPLLLGLLLAGASLTGCLGLFGDDPAGPAATHGPSHELPPELVNFTLTGKFKNYTFPGQQELPPAVVWFNDTVGPEANLGFENVRDDGGNRFNVVVKTLDVARYIPPGQPTEVGIRLFWNAAEAKSADLDIYVDVPGRKVRDYPTSEELNLNIPVRTLIVNTVGVPGQPHLVGIEASNGRTASSIDFYMELSFSYAKDALTPHHAYAFDVPKEASGLILDSVKAAGDEHVSAKFVILDPFDEPVTYMEYDDTAIPTESVFVPTRGPGQYVFYAYEMRGGFLGLASDVPVPERNVTTLPLVEERVIDASAAAPGTPARNWLAPNDAPGTPLQGGTVVDASFPFFPLRVTGFIEPGPGGATAASQVRIDSGKGLVSEVTRIARWDGDAGSLGYTDDEGRNALFQPGNLAKGAYKITIVNNGMDTVGHTVLRYQR